MLTKSFLAHCCTEMECRRKLLFQNFLLFKVDEMDVSDKFKCCDTCNMLCNCISCQIMFNKINFEINNHYYINALLFPIK